MRVYESIVFDWDGNVLEESSYDYDGELALCKGGSSKGGSSYTAPPADPIPDTRTTEVGSAATRDAETEELRRRRGMSGTVLTSPSGTLGTVASQQSNILGVSGL